VGRCALGPLPPEVAPPQDLPEVGGRDDDPPLLGQPPRRLPDRPRPGAGGGVGIQPLRQGEQIGLGQPGRSAATGAVGQAGEALGRKALDELAHRLRVVAEGRGRLRHGRPLGHRRDHPQPLVDVMGGGPGTQPAVELIAFGGRQGEAERRLHGGVPFHPS
jgi:hypothetical protein